MIAKIKHGRVTLIPSGPREATELEALASAAENGVIDLTREEGRIVLRVADVPRSKSLLDEMIVSLESNPDTTIPVELSQAIVDALSSEDPEEEPLDAPRARWRPYKPDQLRVDAGDYTRASGDAICTRCNVPYYDHAPVVGFEFLRRACDGRLLKL
jgi:hypothetical protein